MEHLHRDAIRFFLLASKHQRLPRVTYLVCPQLRQDLLRADRAPALATRSQAETRGHIMPPPRVCNLGPQTEQNVLPTHALAKIEGLVRSSKLNGPPSRALQLHLLYRL